MYYKKYRWFLISEVLISTLLLVVFLFGIYKFFNVQNKNMDYLLKEYNAVNLSEDAMIALVNYNYSKILEWYYGVYYEEKSIFEWEYKVKIITTSDSSYEDGKYIDKNGYKVNYDPTADNINVYKMIIQISSEQSSWMWQKYKNASINIWHPACDFDWASCVTKNFIITQKNEYK